MYQNHYFKMIKILKIGLKTLLIIKKIFLIRVLLMINLYFFILTKKKNFFLVKKIY